MNHETLYLAVKLVDMYLDKHTEKKISRERLQLVGTTALYISAKYDVSSLKIIDHVSCPAQWCSCN